MLAGGLSATLPLIIIAVAVVIFALVVVFASRYKKCPSDKIMVIYGKVGTNRDGTQRSAKCIHGGAAFIVPIVQSYDYLDLTPLSIPVDLTNALSHQNIRVDVPSRFTVGISTEVGVMQNAAERLLGLKLAEIQELAKDIIFGQLRLVIATMDIEEINTDRDKFLDAVSGNVETELKKIGLRLINVNVTDIDDESGYIAALGKEAAAKAINDAKISVAEADRNGAIGASAAEKDQRINVSRANSEAIAGENEAKAKIAESDATRREREAEANKRAVAAENIQAARALEESYAAQRDAENARATLEKARLEADIIVKAEIAKKEAELKAEAEAEQMRRKARGEADAILMKMQAEAAGAREILVKQAEGLAQVVASAGGDANAAIRLMVTDKLEDLTRIQVDAIKNLKIDKVTVWDNGQGGADGKSSTAGFISGLYKSVPPLTELFDMAGMRLPEYLGKPAENSSAHEAGTAE
ncbi:MAG: SPFH domain-containing protein [Eubacteriales bacterium]|nr:SPFH domain-containing protein [Clostridiales bacterium]MDY5860819.1 SPFH domain-containing protein [Eubacteriales bacterium]HCG67988.1 flotillin [Clostridiales bacterium]